MNDTSFHLPWIQFILQLWLEGEATTQDTINLYEKAKSLGVITEDEIFWHVDSDWFHGKLASDEQILNVKSSEDFALLVLGISEFMARTAPYMTRDVVSYISKAPASDKISECLLCIDNEVKAHLSYPHGLSIETQGELQFVNGVEITPKNFKAVDRLFGNGPQHIIRSHSYGLSGGLTLLLKIDAPAVGAWLQSQDHPLILDAALYGLKHAYMLILSTGHEQEIYQLARSAHPLISLTGLVVAHTAQLEKWHPVWSVSLDEAFKLLENAGIPIGMSVWASLFRIAEISKAYEREKQNHQESKRHYAYASENPDYLYGKKEHHYENIERQVKQKEFFKNTATEIIQVIILHWPSKGLSKEALKHCAEIISSSEIWLQFLEKIPVVSDREFLLKHTLRAFISASDLFKSGERGHCYATEQTLKDADFAAQVFLLMQHDNLGRSFGNMFFSTTTKSLTYDCKILSEPYAHRKRFDSYNHALNALGVGHYIALQIGTEGYAQKKGGAEYLLHQGILGLIKVISAAQGSWDVADNALKTFSLIAIEVIVHNVNIVSSKEIEPFLKLQHLQYSFRAMLGLANIELFKRQSEYVLSLLEQSLWPTTAWSQHYDCVISSFLAFDFALMQFAKYGDVKNACRVEKIWEQGVSIHTDPIPKALDGAIAKMKKALSGNKQCSEWLLNNPSLGNTWSANYLRAK
ncbi:hypothetical protein HMPREF0326_03095 [Desulfovibrio sp. 3_1_syn3]|uniref:hypothetical protein n=1 Tax=Desulfovibrio sp. 3_1_syn3 TaxID=457398 RepID=UPI0001E12DE1|nr:hypothetical protein [Desulfovibrio sp. 3_1_syn3]EFL84402.1 hypothetical protein HMPREF0326_03095 [Desulfovibrio sp. 3_1_syn3]